jgi:hypothetical protein
LLQGIQPGSSTGEKGKRQHTTPEKMEMQPTIEPSQEAAFFFA